MSEVLSGVLKLAFGFLTKKFRSEFAERLKDGDVTDEECRRLIVRELDDIKTKLDGLARKDLLSSLCFLQEGINALYHSLQQFQAFKNTTSSIEEVVLDENNPQDSCPDSHIDEAIALVHAVASLKMRTKERFESAMKSFELSREKATEAFCNEALSIEDRIQASQIRTAARILEKLEYPEAGVSDCLPYLQQLHDIRAVREIFSVVINGGFKSGFNKTKRLNIVASVHLMNQLLFQFARKFTKSPPAIFDWPTISCGGKIHHPVFGQYPLLKRLEKFGVKMMSPCPDFSFGDEFHPLSSLVNSKREIIAEMQKEATIKVLKPSRENRTLCEGPKEEHASECRVVEMEIDDEDNLYVITRFQESDYQPWSFKLFLFDANGERKLESALPFHQSALSEDVYMSISKDGLIAIVDCTKKILYLGSIVLNLFKVDKSCHLKELTVDECMDVRFSDINETKLIVADKRCLFFYTREGEFERKIKIPEGHGPIWSVAINHITQRILVKTYGFTPYSLFIFSEDGELVSSLCLGCCEWICRAELASHPSGAIALVGEKGATFLQL